MVRAAVEGDERFAVCDYEVRRGGVNYTIDTVRYLETQYPGAALYWVIGADQVAQLGKWTQIAELARRVKFIALARPGWTGLHDPAIAGLGVRLLWCEGHQLALSSTEVRQRVARGLPIDFMIPHKTVEYIRENSLYRQK
jgi:nicotinate-nucleotide adenylyltransferase